MNDSIGILLVILRLIMALTLYAFLAWSLLLIWQEVKISGQTRQAAEYPTLVLKPQIAGDYLSIQRFKHTQITIGRHPSCELLLTDETVSSQHARLYYKSNQWWLEDLNSRNGTILNNTPVTIPTVLTSGDEIRCGDVSFVVEFEL
jgi:hypothetical protein